MSLDIHQMDEVKAFNAGYAAGLKWKKNGAKIMYMIDELLQESPNSKVLRVFARGYMVALEHVKVFEGKSRKETLKSLREKVRGKENSQERGRA